MDINTYSALALRTANSLGQDGDRIHATLGIVSEAGEIADTVKKSFAYGKKLDKDNLLEECGDLVWFLNLMIHNLDLTWEQVLAANIAKLEKRYPNLRFDAEHALNRNKQVEIEGLLQAANDAGAK